jgi:hypothetical protein
VKQGTADKPVDPVLPAPVAAAAIEEAVVEEGAATQVTDTEVAPNVEDSGPLSSVEEDTTAGEDATATRKDQTTKDPLSSGAAPLPRIKTW